MTNNLTVSVALLRPVLQYVAGMGIKTESLLAGTAIDPVLLNSPDTRLSLEEMDRIYIQAMRLTKDENLGLHIGECFAFGSMSIAGHIMRNCRTFGEQLRKVIEYNEIVSDGFRMNYHREKKGLVVVECTIMHTAAPLVRQHVEAIFSAVMKLSTDAAGKIPKPLEVRFKHKKPRDITEHRRIFQAPVFFNSSTNAMVHEASYFDTPVILPNSELLFLFERQAKQVLSEIRAEQRFTKKVGLILIRKLSEESLSIESVADELCMSVRNLQKKLGKENTSYREIIKETRKQLAVFHLKNRELSIAEIAYLLGFSEPCVLQRSFKKWTGLTPSEYRSTQFTTH
ncbi:MAG: AraC family transcriptional regulator [Deltaproteobacteria bacterium]|nr:AraC family transcriptional regulator [Deltaproteobacteria bacterium]